GAQTFQVTLKHLDLFGYIGGFSGAGGGFGGVPFDRKTAHNGVMADAGGFNKKVRLLWLGIGTAEPKRMYDSVRKYHQALGKAGGTRRRMQVYTPPGYTKGKKYPVLYLLHGIGGDETEWQRFARPDILLDNLLAEGKVVPMIVVMPNGRARKNDRAEGNVYNT